MNLIGEKYIKLQDAKYKHSGNNNNETGIFIDQELAAKLNLQDNSTLTFTLKKSNLIEALNFTHNFQMPLFLKKSIVFLDEIWYKKELSLIDSHFKITSEYHCHVCLESGNRFYLNGLLQETGFNIRNLLIEDHFILKFYHDYLGKIIVEVVFIHGITGKRDIVFYKNSSLRLFAFEVFKRMYQEFGAGFLEMNFEDKNTRIGDIDYVGLKFPNYFGNSKLLAIFDQQKLKDIKSSTSRFRYQNEPLSLFIPDTDFYFTTEFEYNRSNESHLLFDDFRRFVQDYSNGHYSMIRDDNKDYLLIPFSKENSMKTVIFTSKSLREFAFKSFEIVHAIFGDTFLENEKKYSNRKHGAVEIEAITFPNYFGNKKILAAFSLLQTKDSLMTASSMRFNPKNLKILGHEYIYFSSQWSYPEDPTHPNFVELVKFINDYSSGLFFIEYDDEMGLYKLIKNTVNNSTTKNMPIQKIFFGSPGSGKSHHIKSTYPGSWPRITFHPELDYQGFIGAYKPSMIKIANGEQISYRFIAEAFIKAYCKAWETNEPYFLIIEEINRGNCAQIFGDIFQLLDRGIDGFSEYPILCSQDVQEYLSANLKLTQRVSEYIEKTGSDDFSSMSLPNNLNIICSMNTSDQSLFPMDSAFKRRWDWHYIPIDYNDANKFEIDLGNGKFINWGSFIKGINEKIREHTQSEDKQIGNRFVSTGNFIISAEQFVYKVIFYLWSEIYKDEHLSGNTIFYIDKNKEISFSDFFNDSKIDLEITEKFVEFNLNYSDIGTKNNDIADSEIERLSIENG
jgi:hypothetical protein